MNQNQSLKQRILAATENHPGKFSAVDVADKIDYPVKKGFAFYTVCPQVRRVLTQLCKEGILYQWVVGISRQPFGLSKACPYETYYLRRDGELAKTLLENRSHYLQGYRFR